MQNKYLSDIINVDPENDIEHHGVLGMKWGIRRYQPYSLIPRKSGKGGKETGTAKKKGKSAGKPVVSKRASAKKVSEVKKKSRNQRSAEARAAIEKQAKTARQRKEEAERILKSGDAKAIYEHRNEFTKKQLDEAIARIDTERRLKGIVAEQNPSTLSKFSKTMDTVKTVGDALNKGYNTYKTIKDITNEVSTISKAKKLADSANAAEILKNKSKYSTQELNDFKNRLSYEKDLADKINGGTDKKLKDLLNDSSKYEEVWDNRGKYTNDEIKDYTNRLNYESNLEGAIKNKKNRKKK